MRSPTGSDQVSFKGTGRRLRRPPRAAGGRERRPSRCWQAGVRPRSVPHRARRVPATLQTIRRPPRGRAGHRARHQAGGLGHVHGAGIYRQPRRRWPAACSGAAALGIGPQRERIAQGRGRHQAQPGARRVVRLERARCARRVGVAVGQRRRRPPPPAPRAPGCPDAAAPACRASNRRSPIRCRRRTARRRARRAPSPNSPCTCAAVVGLMRPKRLALGAATPCTPRAAAAASSACASG